MKESILLLFLAWNTLLDIRNREISLLSVAGVSLAGLCFALAGHTVLWDFLLPVGTGSLFLGFSLLTGGKIGMGDAWILIAMGTMLDIQTYVTVLMTGLLLASAWSAYLMVMKKRKGTTEIPFLPFLLFGYLAGLCMR